MSLPPQTVSVSEIAKECQNVAQRWPESSLRLAILTEDDGIATRYLVGGPVAAQIFAQLGLKADLKHEEMAVHISALPRPIHEAPPLARLGYLVICYDWEGLPFTAILVILTKERAKILKSLSEEMSRSQR